MDTLKRWLSQDENRRTVPDDQLNIVLHEFQWQTVGIQGGRIFTFTFSLLWNVSASFLLKIYNLNLKKNYKNAYACDQ